jgi:hypothetical protein
MDLPSGFQLDEKSAVGPAGPSAPAAPADPSDLPAGFKLDEQPTSSSSSDLPPGFVLDNDYNAPDQEIKAGLEGAAQGFLSKPLATGIETHLLGVDPKDIAGREEASPWIHGLTEAGGLGAGFMTGTGEAGVLMKAGEFGAEAAGLGKIGSAAIKGLIENGLIQGGDEIGNAMLGKGDPNTPVSSALVHMGAASLLGAGIGGALGTQTASNALKAITETKAGTKISDFMADFGSQWKHRLTNPDLTDAVSQELTDFHGSTMAAHGDVYGASGLKEQAIEKLVPPMNDAISGQSQTIADNLQGKISDMVKDPDTYPPRLTKKLMGDVQGWMETATAPEASSNDVFNATQDLKQKLQAYSKFDRQVGPLSPEKDFINVAKGLQHDLRLNLEDSGVWGKAGELQQGVNKAFTDFLPAMKDFESKFTTKIQDVPTIDPGKVQTYINQIGNARGEIARTKMKNFVDAAEEYRNQISKLHDNLGVESNITPPSLNAVKGSLGQPTNGGKFADFMFGKGIPDLSNITAGGVGMAAGATIGGPFGGMAAYAASQHLGRIFENTIGHRLNNVSRNTLMPAFMKLLSTGERSGILKAMDYAGNVAKGSAGINSGVESLFKSGAASGVDYSASAKDREKLKNYVESGQQNKDLEAQANQQKASPVKKAPHFAQGGMVEKQAAMPPTKPATPILQNTDAISKHFPEQAMLLNAAKGRINNYLNSVRPTDNPQKLPFDDKMEDKEKSRSYDRALDIANKPLSVIDHIKKGTLTPEHVKHLNSMYPEVTQALQKKMTEKITNAQMDDEKPSYKVRQGMSLFLGAPLDSTMTPLNIQAAQSVFAMQAQQQAAQGAAPMKNKKNTSTLSKTSKQYETADQARQSRQNK